MLELTKKKSERSLVGLEIEAGSVAAIEVRSNGSHDLAATAIAPLPPGAFQEGEVIDSDAIAETLRATFAENGLPKRVRLGIANQRVVVRTLRLPAIDDPRELEAAVRFQAEERIPMPIDQAILDHRVVGGVAATEDEGARIDVVVVAARRDMITASLKPLRDAGLHPVGVDLSAFGLIRALGGNGSAADDERGHPSTTLFCNIGDGTNLAVANGRSCLFTRVAPAGPEGIAADLSAGTGLALENARLWLAHVGLAQPLEAIEGDPALIAQVRGALERGASALLDELRLSLDFYGAQEGAVAVERIVLTGPGSVIPGLAEQMAPVLGLPIEVGRPAALAGLDPAAAARLTLSYGLALEA
ncbi:MAG: type IV pilus assembly protein PilM [Solirubrobacterales bacterium]|nr:type IV pilus assembly protein PilM [Solirubrobacterales bacterium]